MLKLKTIWGRIRYRLDTELLPGSGTLKKRKGIQNKSFRIHSTACLCWIPKIPTQFGDVSGAASGL